MGALSSVVERRLYKADVIGSTPIAPTKNFHQMGFVKGRAVSPLDFSERQAMPARANWGGSSVG